MPAEAPAVPPPITTTSYLPKTGSAPAGESTVSRWRKGRMATEDELALYKKWTEEWGMTLDEILSACPAMTSSDKPTFAYLNAILEGMRMEGGVQEAIKSAALTEELAREIYSRAGLKGAPGRREKEAVSTWTVSWHMQPEAVLLAAERSAGYSHPFDRTRRLIEQLHEKGVTTLDIVDAKGFDVQAVQADTVPAQLANSNPGTVAVINGNYALQAGLKVADALAIEDASGDAAQTYANIIACRKGDESSAKVQALVKALQTDAVKTYIADSYNGAVVAIF